MHLAQDNDVVHTFTPDRSDQPFGKAILPRRGWCSRFVPDADLGKQCRIPLIQILKCNSCGRDVAEYVCVPKT